jgi:hypothetical protein
MATKLSCSGHPSRNADLECTACRDFLCRECGIPIRSARGETFQCPNCQGLLRPLASAYVPAGGGSAFVPEPGATAYLRRIPEVAPYALQQSVLFALLGLALINSVLYWAGSYNISFAYGILAVIIAKGLEVAIYFHVVHQSAFGEEQFEPPDFTTFWDDLFAPLLRYLAAVSPIWIAALWYGESQFDSPLAGLLVFFVDPLQIFDAPGPAALLTLGVALLPLLTAVAAVSSSVLDVLNPVTWVKILRAFASTYLAAAVAFYAVLAFEVLVWVRVLLYIRAHFSVPVVTSVVTLALAYLPMILRGRLLGALCEPYVRTRA